MLEAAEAAQAAGARLTVVSRLAGFTARSLQRWKRHGTADRRKGAARRVPRKLSPAERQLVVEVACAPSYRDLTPYLLVAKLLTLGLYLASVSSVYRLLRERKLLAHRSESAPRQPRPAPPERVACGPNQVYTWDITYLKSVVRGIFFYAYLVLDIWDRFIVGWAVHAEERAEHSEELFRTLKVRHQFEGLFAHSDNGGPMKGGTILSTFQALGITPSFSRPRVSDDNPYSESLFSTMKQAIGFPKAFESLAAAREWMARFVDWYNREHLHSGIGLVTPHQRRCGQDHAIFAQRNQALQEAYSAHPQRWSRSPKLWEHEPQVVLNPAERNQKIQRTVRQLS